MSPAFLLPNVASAAPYFRKLPAIQWYSPVAVRFSTASPKFRRCSLAPPSPADPLGVHGPVRLQVVQPAGRPPRPGPQRAPVVRLARLALVDQADDAPGQA